MSKPPDGLTALVAVVNGEAYEKYAAQLFYSATKFFQPTERVEHVVLEGRAGWPDATMYRPRILAENMPEADFVWLIDADSLFEATVGSEILPPDGLGIVATEHPGYVGQPRVSLPYEERPESVCSLRSHEGERYYCGGFIGGDRKSMLVLAQEVADLIDTDTLRGLTPRFHDESALNRVLATAPPDKVLDPSYMRPDDDWYYVRELWTQTYDRRITALDKTAEERAGR